MSESNNMTTKPVQRYEMYDHAGKYRTTPLAGATPSGDWCKSSDVAALEAELTRLRALVERADTMREWAREHLKPPTHQANLSHNRQRFLDALAAYDAARNPANAKGDAHAGE